MTAVQRDSDRPARAEGHFLRHYGEMCAPMCISFAVGDVVYFSAAGRVGYSEPFSELPELSMRFASHSADERQAGVRASRSRAGKNCKPAGHESQPAEKGQQHERNNHALHSL